ncbi:LAGLIDADG family homing endonuclease [Jiangella endophytica]|uniref:LAGLIDADG family homing endonuclease n=1 Tax=Jiangella endophytica TaxID=1623398 RepID=UPI000E3459B2|nr:LAGLIDADG family homing endonuclease [Jiangella endophytica]
MSYIDPTRDDHAYFLGFFQTDGHLYAGRGRKGRAAIEISARDVDILYAFSDLFPDVPTSVTERVRATNFSPGYHSVVWGAQIQSFREELIALGVPVGRKSDTVRPPTVPFDTRGYLRGLIDGDGSVGFTGTGLPFVSLTTASEAIATFFCEQVLAITGARRTPRRNGRDGVFGPMVASDPAADLAAWLYPPGCLALARKSAAAQAVAAWRRPAGMRARPMSRRAWTREDDEVVRSHTIKKAAELLGRTEKSVNIRRWRLRQSRPEPAVAPRPR